PAIVQEQQERVEEPVAEADIPLKVEASEEMPTEPTVAEAEASNVVTPSEGEPAIAQEAHQEIEIEPAAQAVVPVEPQTPQEMPPEPMVAEAEAPSVATTQTDLIPEATQEVIEEIKEAAVAFETGDLPVAAVEEAPAAPQTAQQSVVEKPAEPAVVPQAQV